MEDWCEERMSSAHDGMRSIMGLSVVMWVLFGYSLSFGGNHAGIIGDFRWFGLHGIKMNEAGPYASTIPHLVYIAFQMMFAMITPALITGSLWVV